MRLSFTLRRAPLLAAAILGSAAVGACAHPNNVYDNVYNDQHRWDSREDRAYRQWEAQRSMNHVEYQRRNADEQRAYWQWRHQNPQ